MTLLNAPAYDPRRDIRNRNIIIGTIVSLFLIAVLSLTGFVLGHGWLFTDLSAEHKVNKFFDALESKDYPKAYGIYYNDPQWQQHPQQYSYSLKDFTNDWTTDPRTFPPITSHHVDISKTDGKGLFGTGYIVAVRVNLQDGIPKPNPGEDPSEKPGHKLFMYVNKKDGTLSWPAPHELQYD
jgi:hypothetical protein